MENSEEITEIIEVKNTPTKINDPQQLMSIALQNNVDITVLEKLMKLQTEWEQKEAKKAFFLAFSKMQGEIPTITKNKKVDFILKSGGRIKYEYATLDQIRKSIQPALTKFGFSYRWEFEDKDSKIYCTCLLSHSGGHTERSSMSAGRDTSGKKSDIQQIASTRTYLQRYTLIGSVGLTSAEDDSDGREPKPKAAVTEKQTQIFDNAKVLINEYENADELKKNGNNIIKGLELPKSLLQELKSEIQKKYNLLVEKG